MNVSKGQVGDWRRHTSSSGKEYYFHVTKQISQWEKPREWLEHEKRHGLVPNVPHVSSSQKQIQNKSHQSHHHQQQQQQHHHHQSQNSGSNHVNTSSSGGTGGAEQRERDRKSSSFHHSHHQQQQQHVHNATSNNSVSNSNSFSSNLTASSNNSLQHHQSAISGSNVHHSHHPSVNNHRLDSNSTSSTHPTLSFGARVAQTNDIKSANNVANNAANAASAASLRDTRKPSEDLQTEDMDISPLDDSNSPVSTDSKSHLNSHHHPQNQNTQIHPAYQSHYHPHHYTNSKNLQDGSDSSRDDPLRNSAFHQHQHPASGRLTHSGIMGNNGYYSRDRDRDRDMRDSPRRIDRDFRDKDVREYRDYRDKDSRDRDRMRRDRDLRDSPRRYDRDRNDRDRDHRSRIRDNRDHRDRDNRLRHRSNSRLRDERSRSPRERDSTPERPGGDSTGVSGLGSLGALAALNSDAETTPLQSLAPYFRVDLIAHAQDLPGDELERQANKLASEIMTTSSVQLSKVCAELKMARSLVRLTDIQATLQDQRILFLRQQIKNLEESDHDCSASMLGLDTGDS